MMFVTSGVIRSLSQEWANLGEGAHRSEFGYAIISSQKLMHVISQKQKIFVG